jgi:ankyrin repeat protein
MKRISFSDFVETVKYKKEMRDVSWRNKNGENRLHLAAKIDNIKEITSLIQYGHDVNAVDNAGWTPLMASV